jgi:hypothetical protein
MSDGSKQLASRFPIQAVYFLNYNILPAREFYSIDLPENELFQQLFSTALRFPSESISQANIKILY